MVFKIYILIRYSLYFPGTQCLPHIYKGPPWLPCHQPECQLFPQQECFYQPLCGCSSKHLLSQLRFHRRYSMLTREWGSKIVLRNHFVLFTFRVHERERFMDRLTYNIILWKDKSNAGQVMYYLTAILIIPLLCTLVGLREFPRQWYLHSRMLGCSIIFIKT